MQRLKLPLGLLIIQSARSLHGPFHFWCLLPVFAATLYESRVNAGFLGQRTQDLRYPFFDLLALIRRAGTSSAQSPYSVVLTISESSD